MSEATTGEAEVLRLRQSIETQMRRRILEAIELVLEEELTEALGTGRYERGDTRCGFRNGHQTRWITTAVERRRSRFRGVGSSSRTDRAASFAARRSRATRAAHAKWTRRSWARTSRARTRVASAKR